MIKIIALGLIVLAFFYPWITLIILGLITLYLTFVYFSTRKKGAKIISKYKEEITKYFDEKIGNGNFHYNYIKKNSVYFLFPSSSKLFAETLRVVYFMIILIIIIHYFRFENTIGFSAYAVPIIIISLIISTYFVKPILDYKDKEKSYVRNTPLYNGVDVYPDFFYYGPWKNIKNQKNE